MQEKSKKYAKKFAYIKNLLYLCTRFRKQTNNKTPAATENSGKKVMITKTQNEKGFTSKTNYQVRNDKRDFKYALLAEGTNGAHKIWKLCNDARQMEREFNQWYISHAIAVEIETGRVLLEKTR